MLRDLQVLTWLASIEWLDCVEDSVSAMFSLIVLSRLAPRTQFYAHWLLFLFAIVSLCTHGFKDVA